MEYCPSNGILKIGKLAIFSPPAGIVGITIESTYAIEVEA
jgi:hypothetical protein